MVASARACGCVAPLSVRELPDSTDAGGAFAGRSANGTLLLASGPMAKGGFCIQGHEVRYGSASRVAPPSHRQRRAEFSLSPFEDPCVTRWWLMRSATWRNPRPRPVVDSGPCAGSGGSAVLVGSLFPRLAPGSCAAAVWSLWRRSIPGVFFETCHARSLLLMFEVGSRKLQDPYRRADSDAESRYGNKTSLQSQPLGRVPQQIRLVAISTLQDGGCSQSSNHAPLPYTGSKIAMSRVTVNRPIIARVI